MTPWKKAAAKYIMLLCAVSAEGLVVAYQVQTSIYLGAVSLLITVLCVSVFVYVCGEKNG